MCILHLAVWQQVPHVTAAGAGFDAGVLLIAAYWALSGCCNGSHAERCGVVRRLAAFDNVRQVQVAGLLVHRPDSANDFQDPSSRSK